MNKYYLILLSFIFNLGANAQTSFAPLGAQWHHNMHAGIFQETVVGDTMINGVSSSIIRHRGGIRANLAAQGFKIFELPDIYLSTQGDTVFVYNHFFKQHTPLYIFGLMAGDTVKLPYIPPYIGSSSSPLGDSTFTFVVDSVKTVNYNGEMLETVYTTTLEVNGKKRLTYNGPYAEKLGCINNGLLPKCSDKECAYPLSDNIAAPTSLRCYEEGTISVKLDTGTCTNNTVWSSIEEQVEAYSISVSPNPAQNVIMISNLNTTAKAMIYDVSGRLMSTTLLQQGNNKIDITGLPSGLYNLQLLNKDYLSTTKFVKE